MSNQRRYGNRICYICVSTVLLMLTSAQAQPTEARSEEQGGPVGTRSHIEGDSQLTVTVGMEGFARQVVYSGTELTNREVDPRRTPVALRIDEVYAHGNGFRYDLTFTGLEPGTHNLTDYLVRKDGTSTDDLPSLTFVVESILPTGRLDPSDPPRGFVARMGGYRMVVVLTCIVWVLGLLLILFAGRKNSPDGSDSESDTGDDEVDQIRRLIERAMTAGELSTAQKADLDMRVLNFWRSRKQVADVSVTEAVAVLKNDEQAGPLLSGLEQWFYSRNPPSREHVREMLQEMKAVGLGVAEPGPESGANL